MTTIRKFSIRSVLWVLNRGSVLSILTQFILNRSQHVIVDSCRSKLVNDVSRVPRGNILGRYCSPIYLGAFPNSGE